VVFLLQWFHEGKRVLVDGCVAPHDLDIIYCVFERTGEAGVRMVLMKGEHTVR